MIKKNKNASSERILSHFIVQRRPQETISFFLAHLSSRGDMPWLRGQNFFHSEHLNTSTWIFLVLIVDKNRHFWITYPLVMRPSRAGSSHSSSWSIFSSARLGSWPFFLQLELFFQLENLIYSFFSSNFLFSPQNFVILQRNSIIYRRIEWKLYCFFLKWLIFGVKKENWSKKAIYQRKKSSSLSARKLKCPSSAQLGTFIARARSSRKIPARTHHYLLVTFNQCRN